VRAAIENHRGGVANATRLSAPNGGEVAWEVKRVRFAATLSILVAAGALVAGSAQARSVTLDEYTLPGGKLAKLGDRMTDQITSRYGTGTWAPLRFNLHNRDLRLMGLPSKRVLLSHRYRVPTAVYPNGKLVRLAGKGDKGGKGGHGGHGGHNTGTQSSSPGVVTYAGAGFAGIRPGAWLLLINDDSIGWCSMAHVYGSAGSYAVSTAGHCGKPGDVATVIGAVGDHSVDGVPVPVLLDFGTFQTSHDGGLGNDWALIPVDSAYQGLVTPTMAFWGGPLGMYTAEGDVVDPNLSGKEPSVSVSPDPALVQQIVHYGHGAGIGAGGTPRSGTAIAWGSTHFMFFGAITPGDSGSGANTLTGDNPGDNREAAGIITHIWVDSLMREGLGIMGGTRATQVGGTLANGQLLPYPAPVPQLP
jgi:hypothetical protein